MKDKAQTAQTEIRLSGLQIRQGKQLVAVPDITLKAAEPLIICGSSGTGKTQLGQLLAGPLEESKVTKPLQALKRCMVYQQDNFIALSGLRSSYNGQRYENQGMENCPILIDYLQSFEPTTAALEKCMQQLSIEHLRQRKLLQLSNGERKRTQLAAALLQKPDLLVLDQPFVGLDVVSRQHLQESLAALVQKGVFLIIIAHPKQVQWARAQVLSLSMGNISSSLDIKDYHNTKKEISLPKIEAALIDNLHQNQQEYKQVIAMKQVNVRHGDKHVLKNIDWEVAQGDHWALLGANGAGKSTLLSLVTADNPQGYTNNLVLFDRKRGSGESIWDIKAKIGYVSPELHQYFLRGKGIANTIPGMRCAGNYDRLSCVEIIASGFRDEIGFSSCTDLERQQAQKWLQLIKMSHLESKPFNEQSLGQQRLLLLARALIKAPALLLLDEPCQGLDPEQKQVFTHILNQLCQHIKCSMVYVTHYRDEIPSSVSKYLELADGEVCNTLL